MVSRNYVWTLNNYTEDDVSALTSESFKEKVTYSIFAKEVGEKTKTPHLQGYTVFRSPQRLAGVKKLISGRIFAEPRRGSHQQALDYCKKSGDFTEYEGEPPKDKRSDAFAEALSATSYDEACTIIRTKRARDWCISGEKIRESLKRQFVPPFKEYVPIHVIEEFKVPPQLTYWLGLWKESRTKCLFLIGETQLGKTAWARSLASPHTYWKGMINLEDWNPDSKLLIFDDFEWQYLQQPKSFLTQAGDATVTDKYKKKKNICVTMPAIYIANDVPEWTKKEEAYWMSNIYIVHVNKKLY